MNGTSIFQRLGALADATRGRLLHLLERYELTVGELCTAMQLPQSTVSRHLRVLNDEGWLTVRSEGTSRYYRMGARLESESRRLWEVVREALGVLVDARGQRNSSSQPAASPHGR